MTREEKEVYVNELAEQLQDSGVFYLTDASELTVEQVNDLRRTCFNGGIQLKVVKNTLLRKALERFEDRDYDELIGVLSGPTAIMFAEKGNGPAKVIKEFRKKAERPILKAAYIDECTYVGDGNLEFLTTIKGKEELLGDVIGLLQSPAKNVISALQSSGQTIAGIVKTLQEKEG